SRDSDSVACLAGAFAGAHLGADAWPADWADRVEYRGDLLALGALWDA
ncbi:ADP-ribosylglycohydrolase family protein, partial [Streptomyces olivaceus]